MWRECEHMMDNHTIRSATQYGSTKINTNRENRKWLTMKNRKNYLTYSFASLTFFLTKWKCDERPWGRSSRDTKRETFDSASDVPGDVLTSLGTLYSLSRDERPQGRQTSLGTLDIPGDVCTWLFSSIERASPGTSNVPRDVRGGIGDFVAVVFLMLLLINENSCRDVPGDAHLGSRISTTFIFLLKPIYLSYKFLLLWVARVAETKQLKNR